MNYITIAAKDVLVGDEVFTGGGSKVHPAFHWSRVREVKPFVTKGYVEIVTWACSIVKHSEQAVAVRR